MSPTTTNTVEYFTADGPISLPIAIAVGIVVSLVIAWTLFSGDSRETFRQAVGQDEATWVRARGWALWKALLVLAECIDTDHERAAVHEHVIGEVLADVDRFG